MRYIIGTFKSKNTHFREISTSWKSFSIRRNHLQTCHIDGVAVAESVTAAWGVLGG
jgi:hypothetical protein